MKYSGLIGMNLFRIAYVVMLLPFSIIVNADYVSAPLQATKWTISHSKTLCELQQEIREFGSAGFHDYSGEPLRFSFKENDYRSRISQASLFVEPAPWRDTLTYQPGYQVFLDEIGPFHERGRLSVYGDGAETMLEALLSGHYPVFSYIRQSSEIRVGVSAINFSEAYKQFIDCRKNLLPFGKRQLQQGSLFFAQKSKVLTPQIRKRIRHVAGYLKEIKKNYVVVISETSMIGKADNKWFQERAKQITHALSKLGIAENRLFIRAGKYTQRKDNELVFKVFGPDVLRFFYYRKGNTRLNAKEKQRLDLLARYSSEYFHSGQLVISSHTDSKGSRSGNLKISQQRGDVIKQYLVSKGVPAEQIRVKAYGESRPAKSNRFPPGRAQNRRAIISFVN
jgi:outer membrane protein OmpA-like peptidoglycan-associated protein